MLNEKNLYFLAKIPDKVQYSLWALALTLSANLVVQNWWWLGAVYAPLYLYLEALSRSERAVGFMVARRGTVALSCVGLILLLFGMGVFFGWWQMSDAVGEKEKYTLITFDLEYISFVVVGAILGALIRYCFSSLMSLALLGKRRLGMNVLSTAVWTVGVILYPGFGVHRGATPYFILGFASGILLSRSFRLRLARAVAGYRRVQDIADAWPPNAEAKPAELEALRLLARGRQFPGFKFRTLRRRLIDWSEGGKDIVTSRLALISASVFRLEGDHEHAIAEVDRALAATGEDPEKPIVAPAVAHLLLLKALSLFETGKDESAYAVIEKILDSPAGEFCPLSRATLAARQAEVVLKHPLSVEANDEALENTYIALDNRKRLLALRSKRRPEKREAIDLFLTRFPEIGIPVTATFMRDILGQCHIAAGYPEEGKVFLESCIDIDRVYSPSYLHMGEYFLFRNALRRAKIKRGESMKHDLWHARACFFAARFVERNVDSRVRRLATARLGQIKEVEDRISEK